MASTKRTHPGRGGHKITLAPLSPEDAFAALAQVKLSDVKKLEAKEAAQRPAVKKRRTKRG